MGQTRLFKVGYTQILNFQRRSFEHYKSVFLTNLRSIQKVVFLLENTFVWSIFKVVYTV